MCKDPEAREGSRCVERIKPEGWVSEAWGGGGGRLLSGGGVGNTGVIR